MAHGPSLHIKKALLVFCLRHILVGASQLYMGHACADQSAHTVGCVAVLLSSCLQNLDGTQDTWDFIIDTIVNDKVPRVPMMKSHVPLYT